MKRAWRRAFWLVVLLVQGSIAHAAGLDELYTSQAIVTGTGETNRQPGFRDCLEGVLLRVSGDQRLITQPAVRDLKARAGSFVQSYTYHDRLAGRPVHDEQGTHDRPHDLTCRYDPAVINGLLAELGSHPWLVLRPQLRVFLDVSRSGKNYRVNARDVRDEAMREAFAQAASPLAMSVVFPAPDDRTQDKVDASSLSAAEGHGSDLPIFGSIVWSDADLGWVATWSLEHAGKVHRWQVRGVNFDDAFRVAVRGTAQILSGNGEP